MILDPEKLSPAERYFLLIGAIVPRPIAFVSSRGTDGSDNVAPFSFFSGVSADPPVVSLAIAHRQGTMKDTLRNIKETGEFAINIVNEQITDAMVEASGDYPYGRSEFETAKLTPVDSEVISAPRVLESPVSFECRLRQVVPVGEPPRETTLVLGDVVCVHVDDQVWDGRGIDAERLRAVGRMGGKLYVRTRDLFAKDRPKVKE